MTCDGPPQAGRSVTNGVDPPSPCCPAAWSTISPFLSMNIDLRRPQREASLSNCRCRELRWSVSKCMSSAALAAVPALNQLCLGLAPAGHVAHSSPRPKIASSVVFPFISARPQFCKRQEFQVPLCVGVTWCTVSRDCLRIHICLRTESDTTPRSVSKHPTRHALPRGKLQRPEAGRGGHARGRYVRWRSCPPIPASTDRAAMRRISACLLC